MMRSSKSIPTSFKDLSKNLATDTFKGYFKTSSM